MNAGLAEHRKGRNGHYLDYFPSRLHGHYNYLVEYILVIIFFFVVI